ncbi:MAG: AAA family ATPase [Candidatus Micrarchaeales archaeon]
MGKRYVIVGSAATGKSTVVAALRSYKNAWISTERARELASGEGKSFWDELRNSKDNPELHKKARLNWEKLVINADIDAFKTAPVKDFDCFFDCGIGEAIAYLESEKIEIPKEFMDAMKKYRYDKVFLAPVWPELLTNPSGVEKAKEFENLIREVYGSNGYKIIELPHKSPQERADFIMEHLLIQ